MFIFKKRNNLLAGLFLGTLFALIFAPQKGAVLRESIEDAYEKKEDASKPFRRAVVAYFGEISKHINKRVFGCGNNQEKNPFNITKI